MSLTTDCLECGKTFKRMSLKSRVKYCHECRRPKKNRYEQREIRTNRQAVDALATQEEHGKRLDAIEIAQEAHLAEVSTISHDVAAKAANLMSGQIEDALEKLGLGDVKTLMKSMVKLNNRILKVEEKMEEFALSKRIMHHRKVDKMQRDNVILKDEIICLKEDMKLMNENMDALASRSSSYKQLSPTKAQLNRRGRISRVIRFLHKNDVASLNVIMAGPMKDISQVTAYNNLKWATKEGYMNKHKIGQKSVYMIGSKHWSDHYRRKAVKGKAEEEE